MPVTITVLWQSLYLRRRKMENVPDTYMLMEKCIIRKALETLEETEKDKDCSC